VCVVPLARVAAPLDLNANSFRFRYNDVVLLSRIGSEGQDLRGRVSPWGVR